MPSLYDTCPKCGSKLTPPLPASAQCPVCGIYFFKWAGRENPPPVVERSDHVYPRNGIAWSDLQELLLAPKPAMTSATFYGRTALLVFLVIWSWALFSHDYRADEPEFGALYGFFHRIVLPIHEAGHVFMMPFGEFLQVLGGSFWQVALPLGIAVAFIIKNHDNFGAAVCAWWASGSLVDVAEYIYDAQDPRLILLGGHTGNEGPHDWIILLGKQVNHAHAVGILVHTLGGLLMLVMLGWGAVLLWRQRHHLDVFPDEQNERQ